METESSIIESISSPQEEVIESVVQEQGTEKSAPEKIVSAPAPALEKEKENSSAVCGHGIDCDHNGDFYPYPQLRFSLGFIAL